MLQTVFDKILANKHTSGAALVIGGGELAKGLAAIWTPHYAPQVDQTAQLIQRLAMMYGFIMAGDAGATGPTQPPGQTNIFHAPAQLPKP